MYLTRNPMNVQDEIGSVYAMYRALVDKGETALRATTSIRPMLNDETRMSITNTSISAYGCTSNANNKAHNNGRVNMSPNRSSLNLNNWISTIRKLISLSVSAKKSYTLNHEATKCEDPGHAAIDQDYREDNFWYNASTCSEFLCL
jgi:hypothetical protein